jgi:diguanylate cyclase (GGDEF)-like protein/PAS domain S-box-containing protein
MKHFEARPWLVALVTVAAVFAIWHGRDGTVSLTALDVAYSLPLTWVLWPIAGAGAADLIGRAARRRRYRGRRERDITPTLANGSAGTTDQPQPETAAANPTEPAAVIPQIFEPIPAGEERELVIELDTQARIIQCLGPGAVALAADPATLTGASLLELVPPSARSVVVDAVRAARANPGQGIDLPKLRLQMRNAGKPPNATAPLKLAFTARADGTLSIRGWVADPATVATPVAAGDERFSRVFHTSPDAILIIRFRDGTLIDFNTSFTRLLGYSREQAIGQRTVDLNLWVDTADRRALMAQFKRQRHITDTEVRLKSAAGEPVPVEVSLRFIELDGELCVLGVARDISKRLEAELAARSSEEKFSQVFTQSPDGVLILRASDLTIRDVNPAFVRGSGLSVDEIVGRPLSVFDSITATGDLQQVAEALSREGRVANREMRLRSKSGREMTTLVSGTVTEIDGEPSLLCIIKDITELRHAQEQLRRSEERFRGAFENAPIGIMLLDPQGHIFQANRFATELLHYPDRSLDSLHVSRLVPADERGDLKEQLERMLRGSETAVRSERRMLCEDGLEIWTNCHMVLQRGSDGEPLYCIMQIADITEMKTSQRRMERLAFFDTLTELANRRLFNDRLQQVVEHCRRHNLRAALLYLDLDQFKRVNDTLGHESGDVLLKEVAARLLACVRKEDTVGRPGGDEFTILLYDVEAASDAGRVAEKILRALERPITVSGHQLVVTTSIGITVIPDDGVDPNALTRNADLAMYRAKEKGRNNYQFYSEELNTNAVRRLRTEYELRRALERSEFELFFQPTVRLSDQSIVGVECLLRWNHPERGLVGPDEFIGIAEETGAIVEIGNWVIEEACAAARLMIEQHGAPLSIAVNISPRQFRDPELVTTIRQSLRRAQLDPGLLEVEITETMLMQDVDAALEILQRLHELGVRLAIDDFGTGYSSLNYLKKFPIDTVKVDRSFVADIPNCSDDMEITAAVIAMAHRLRMQVVAEGVETQAQLAFLAEQSCDFAQGFLFSPAMPLKDITRLLSARRGTTRLGDLPSSLAAGR